jgi:hypothetical protein
MQRAAVVSVEHAGRQPRSSWADRTITRVSDVRTPTGFAYCDRGWDRFRGTGTPPPEGRRSGSTTGSAPPLRQGLRRSGVGPYAREHPPGQSAFEPYIAPNRRWPTPTPLALRSNRRAVESSQREDMSSSPRTRVETLSAAWSVTHPRPGRRLGAVVAVLAGAAGGGGPGPGTVLHPAQPPVWTPVLAARLAVAAARSVGRSPLIVTTPCRRRPGVRAAA